MHRKCIAWAEPASHQNTSLLHAVRLCRFVFLAGLGGLGGLGRQAVSMDSGGQSAGGCYRQCAAPWYRFRRGHRVASRVALRQECPSAALVTPCTLKTWTGHICTGSRTQGRRLSTPECICD